MQIGKKVAILKGISFRIEADSPIEDLQIIPKQEVESHIKRIERKLENRLEHGIKKAESNFIVFRRGLSSRNDDAKQITYTGKILHIDGDSKYSQKSAKYYREMGLNAVVKNIPESKQSMMIRRLLERYRPDILVITGHDGMIKKETGYSDIYNYRNSKYFIDTVTEARKWEPSHEKLAIFAGACQSFYEALMSAGANFASSPARILIDFADPLIVAERIATTDTYKYLTIDDISFELRDGSKGVGGTGSKGKKAILFI